MGWKYFVQSDFGKQQTVIHYNILFVINGSILKNTRETKMHNL